MWFLITTIRYSSVFTQYKIMYLTIWVEWAADHFGLDLL